MSTEMKLAGGKAYGDQLRVEEFIRQAEQYETGGDAWDTVLKILNTVMRTHPMHTVRAAELLRWHRAGGYDKILAGDYLRRGQGDDDQPLSDDYADAAGYYGQKTRETVDRSRTASAARRTQSARRGAIDEGACSWAEAGANTRSPGACGKMIRGSRSSPRRAIRASPSSRRASPIGATDVAGCSSRWRGRSASTGRWLAPKRRSPRESSTHFAPTALPIFGPTRPPRRSRRRRRSRKSVMADAGVPTARAAHVHDRSPTRSARSTSLGAPRRDQGVGARRGKGRDRVRRPPRGATRRRVDARATARSATPATRCSSKSSWPAKSSRCSCSPTASTSCRFPPRRTTSACSTATAVRTPGGMGAYCPVSLVDAIAGAHRRRARAHRAADARGDARARNAVHGTAVRRADAHAGRAESRRVQLPVRRSGDAGGAPCARRGRDRLRADVHGRPRRRLPERSLAQPTARAVTTVLAAAGYPEQPRTGDRDSPPAVDERRARVSRRNAARRADGALVTAGGRVLASPGLATTHDDAQRAQPGVRRATWNSPESNSARTSAGAN